MPTYEYRCPDCSTEFEKFQKMSEEPVAECPNCGAQAQRKLSGGAGFLFKGSGFYITDYRSDSYKKAAGSESGASGSSDAKSDGGSSSGDSGGKPAASDKSSSTAASESKGGSSKPKAE